MNWSNLSDKEKVRLILEYVYDCFFVESEKYAETYRGQKGVDAGFHYPVAWWDESIECWQVRENWSNYELSFSPLTNLNDAWLIIDYFKPGRVNVPLGGYPQILHAPEVETEAVFQRRARFVDQLAYHMDGWWSWTSDRLCSAICVAVLRACGIEVEG